MRLVNGNGCLFVVVAMSRRSAGRWPLIANWPRALEVAPKVQKMKRPRLYYYYYYSSFESAIFYRHTGGGPFNPEAAGPLNPSARARVCIFNQLPVGSSKASSSIQEKVSLREELSSFGGLREEARTQTRAPLILLLLLFLFLTCRSPPPSPPLQDNLGSPIEFFLAARDRAVARPGNQATLQWLNENESQRQHKSSGEFIISAPSFSS